MNKPWRIPSGVFLRKRALTEAQIRAWRTDIDAKLAALQRAYEKETNPVERDRILMGAVVLCPMPDWLRKGLIERLAGGLPQQPDLHWGRWLLVREAHNKGLPWMGKNGAWNGGAYDDASKQAAGTRWAGKPRTMKNSHDIVQRSRRRRQPGHI
jgi:hypothetical protein